MSLLSKAESYVQLKGWEYKKSGSQLVLQTCPMSGCDNWHFFMSYTDEKDGLWDCKKCGIRGNLRTLRNQQGDAGLDGQTSLQDAATRVSGQQDNLPDIEAAHELLFTPAYDSALEYLTEERGLEPSTIEHFKLGVMQGIDERNYPGASWLCIPYFVKGKLVNCKFRTLPPAEKDFRALGGREMPLFNVDSLQPGLSEFIIAEGEIDAITLWQNGFQHVGGLPGANTQKAAWIKQLDDLAPDKIYLCLDNDKTGQKAAKELANRIGIDKCLNIVLPEGDEEHTIKDPNEFFRHATVGCTFRELMDKARPFAIDGIQGVGEVIDEIIDELQNGKKLGAQYVTQYETLNKVMGGFSDGNLVGILADAKHGKTTLAMNIVDFLIRAYKKPGLIYCLEMSTQELVKKWISHKTGTRVDDIQLDDVKRALAMAADYPADLLFGYTRNAKAKDVFETIRQTHRRYGTKFFVFDNLQLLCRSIDNAATETASVAKEFKNLAMELGVVIFLILQPHRVKADEVASSENIANSSMVAKDLDSLLCIHRNKTMKLNAKEFDAFGKVSSRESFGPRMLVNAELARYASGGITTLNFDGATSTVTELDLAAKNQANRASADAAQVSEEQF